MNTPALHRHADLPHGALPLLDSGTARIWLIDSAAVLPAEQLDETEAQVAAKMNNPARIEAYRAAHLWTRSLLRRELGVCGDPITFARRSGGKPELDASLANHGGRSALRFNYSHTNGYVACAMARGTEIGVDMEEMAPLEELPGLLQFVLHPQESGGRGSGRLESPLDTFFRIWTAKEALLKATGHGLSVNLRQIELRDAQPQTLELVAAPPELAPFLGSLIGHGVLPVNGRRYAYAAALLRRDARFEVMHVAAAEAAAPSTQEHLECATV